MRPLFARPSMLGAMLALLVGGGIYTYMSGTQSTAGTASPRVTIVVAAADIPPRTRIEAAQLRLKDVAADAVHPLAARTPDAVIGKFSTRALRADEQVLSPDVSVGQTGSDLAGIVKTGMRAMSFGISDASAAGGFITPGDHVDVIAVIEESAIVLASDIEVLAVSTSLLGSQPSKDDKAASSNPTSVDATVTLAVPPEFMPRIAIGEVRGAIRLAVRAIGDNSETSVSPIDLDQLRGVLAIDLAP